MITQETWGKVHDLLKNLPEKRLGAWALYDTTSQCACAFGAISGLNPETLQKHRVLSLINAREALERRLGISHTEASEISHALIPINDYPAVADADATARYARVLKTVAERAGMT